MLFLELSVVCTKPSRRFFVWVCSLFSVYLDIYKYVCILFLFVVGKLKRAR